MAGRKVEREKERKRWESECKATRKTRLPAVKLAVREGESVREIQAGCDV